MDLRQFPYNWYIIVRLTYDLNYFEYERFMYTTVGCFDLSYNLGDVFNLT